MARVTLNNETYNAATDGSVISGNTGTEQVTVFAGVTDLDVAGNVERVDLPGDIADFTFSSFGNSLTIYDGDGNVVAAVSGADGKQVVFGDGALDVAFDADTGDVTLGGETVSDDADNPAAVTPAPAEIDGDTTSESPVSVGPAGPTVSVSDNGPVEEGNTVTFTVTLSEAQGTATTVDYAVGLEGGAAVADFGDITAGGTADAAANGTLTFAAGETSKTIEVPVELDLETPETGEGLSVTLSNPSGDVELDSASTTAAITDVEPFELTQGQDSVNEGDQITYTLTTVTPVTEATDVSFAVEPGDASAADQGTNDTNLNDFDQGAFNPSTVTIAAGDSTAEFTLTTQADGITELPEDYDVVATIGGEEVGRITTSLLDGDGDTNVGETFTLTAGIDAGADFTGTNGDDTFVGDSGTISAADSIDGGPGGTDRANLFLDAADESLNSENVENFFLQASGAPRDFSAGNVSGIEQVWNNNSSDDLTVSALGELATVGVRGGNTTDYSVEFADSLASGAADTLDVVLNDDADLNFLAVGGATATNEFETINIANDGDSVLGDLTDSQNTDLAGLETLNISGEGSLEITAQLGDGQDVTVDASGSSVGTEITLGAGDDTFSGGSGDDNVTVGAGNDAFTGGAGDDIVVFAGNLTDDDSADGGDDTDTVGLTVGSTLTEATGAVLTNFETLDIGGAVDQNGANAFDLDNLDGITTLQVSAALNGGGTETTEVDNLDEGASVLLNAAVGAANDTLAITQSGAGAGSPNDTIDVAIEGDADIDTTGVLQIDDIETVNLSSSKGDATGTVTHTIAELEAEEATSVVVQDGTANLTIGETATESLVLFDATAATQDVSLTTTDNLSGVAGGQAFNFGSGDDTLNVSGATLTDNTIINMGDGNDSVIVEAAGATSTIDTFVYEAASNATIEDATADLESIDNFDNDNANSNEDIIDLSAFGFSGAEVAAVLTKAGTTYVSDDTADFFNDAGTDRSVAVIDDGANDQFVYVDVDGNGDLDVDTDMVVELTGLGGGTAIDTADFSF